MFGQDVSETQEEIKYTDFMLRSNLNHSFIDNEDNMFYFVPGMRIKVKHNAQKSLNSIEIPYDLNKPFIQLYSNQLFNAKRTV